MPQRTEAYLLHKLQTTVEEEIRPIIIMAAINSLTTAPNHRQNRRRQHPDSGTRRTEARSIITATKAAPRLLHRDFDQCWQRWKVSQSEETQPEMDKLQQGQERQERQERQRLFGGDGDDDGSLCIAMLDVVMRLFGDIDYTDP
jgi:hypothetical protein